MSVYIYVGNDIMFFDGSTSHDDARRSRRPKSGIEGRSGFRKRSKIRPWGCGSRSVIRIANAHIEPAPDPRPGPTRMPVVLRPQDVVGHHQEVPGVALADDDAFLVLGLADRVLGDAVGKRSCRPRSTSLTNQDSSVSPSGTGKAGM